MRELIMPIDELFVIGVDGGGSKTSAMVLDRFGQVLGRGRSGSSNYHHVGVETAGEHLHHAMAAAAGAAGVSLPAAAAATWCLAGVDRPIDRERLGGIAAELLPGVLVQIENDAGGALVAGLSCVRSGLPAVVSHEGMVLNAGTGMIAFGKNGAGGRARSGGAGYILEQGGGYHLAVTFLQALLRIEEGLGLPSPLLGRFLGEMGLGDVSDLITWLYAPTRQIADIAALAPMVIEEGAKGDVTAVSVLLEGVQALAASVRSVVQRLGWQAAPFRLVFAGSLLTKASFYRELVVQAVGTNHPQVQLVLPQLEAAVGAGLMALESLGLTEKQLEPLGDEASRLWVSERRNLLTNEADEMSALTLVGMMHLQDRVMVRSVWPVLPMVAQVVEAMTPRMRRGGRLIYVGAGTSGRLGVLDAAECPPTFGTPPERVVGVIAGGKTAVTQAVEGAEDDFGAGEQVMATLAVGADDTVVGISASGQTPYVRGALMAARQRGGLTVAVVNNLPTPMEETAVYVIAPLVGPEVITGSTRLKAGTAQKLVLNMLSTAVMVRLGKTYGNLMVDVQPTNHKLKGRASRIVAQACDVPDKEAQAMLAQSDGEVKVAIVSLLAGCTPQESRQRLAAHGGVVRAALL